MFWSQMMQGVQQALFVPTGLPDMNFGAVGMASVEYEHLVMWWIH
jgi:hypothetical protein